MTVRPRPAPGGRRPRHPRVREAVSEAAREFYPKSGRSGTRGSPARAVNPEGAVSRWSAAALVIGGASRRPAPSRSSPGQGTVSRAGPAELSGWTRRPRHLRGPAAARDCPTGAQLS